MLHAVLTSLLVFFGLAQPATVSYQGYAEGEYVLVAPQIAGTLETLSVARGDTVKKGAPLFALDHADEQAALDQAKAQAAAAQATLDDLLKGQRAPEVQTLLAQREQAKAALRLAVVTYARNQKQYMVHAVSKATLDADRASLTEARGKLAEAEANVATGLQSTGRSDAIHAAASSLAAAEAAVVSAEWRLDQKTLAAPTDAFVFDTLERPGEYIPAGQPVVSLLPPGNIRARFFVTEPELHALPAGTAVEIDCDGAPPIAAHVTYVSPQAEYSPPELYNQDNRARLLYMLEATPDKNPQRLHPGQPVDVVVKNDVH
ncbi:MAG TPA: HlyD family efflux transporter periplasmic adaptor subunit [Alphaproteobacteria bacterium]|nr:HlyD family efflux transporter periplasmic adaptor subunit [Alphaproteobacteria bacterium]